MKKLILTLLLAASAASAETVQSDTFASTTSPEDLLAGIYAYNSGNAVAFKTMERENRIWGFVKGNVVHVETVVSVQGPLGIPILCAKCVIVKSLKPEDKGKEVWIPSANLVPDEATK